MATPDDELREPLLVNVEGLGSEYENPRQTIKRLYQSDQVLGRLSPFRGEEDETINISASNSVQNLAELDYIVAIFVVAFDTKAGASFKCHCHIINLVT